MTSREIMTRAVELAREAALCGEVPVGAVIVKDGVIIAEGRNLVEEKRNPLCHAEQEAISSACSVLGSKYLCGCSLYVTLEPCPMCAGAIINSRLDKVVFGAYDKKAGSLFSVQEMLRLPYNHIPELQAGFMERECSGLLTDFFRSLR